MAVGGGDAGRPSSPDLERVDVARFEAKRRLARAGVLVRLSTALMRVDDAASMFERVVADVLPIVRASTIGVVLGTEAEGVQAWAVVGALPDPVKPLMTRRFKRADGGTVWAAIERGGPLYIDDYPSAPDAHPALLAASLTGLAHVPFGALSGEVGLLLALRYDVVEPWSAE